MESVCLNFKCYGQKFTDIGDSSVKIFARCAAAPHFPLPFPQTESTDLTDTFGFNFVHLFK